MGKKKKQIGGKTSDSDSNQNKSEESSSKTFNENAAVFINMAQELKMDGNKLFQKRDSEGALLKYEKALKLLPKSHVDVAYIYMDIGPGEWRKAIEECNLALDISPKYGKALLKRARCYEYLNRLDLALQDVSLLLKSEPNNAAALEITKRVREKLEKKQAADGKSCLVEEVLQCIDFAALTDVFVIYVRTACPGCSGSALYSSATY